MSQKCQKATSEMKEADLFGQRSALHKALYLTFAPLIILLGDDVAHQRYALVTDS